VDSNPEGRKNTRFEYKADVIHEDIKNGARRGAKMFNYSKEGLYFEADFLLKPGDEIYIGIEDSPYSSSGNDYECYRAFVKWRKTFSDSESAYKYGYGLKHYYTEGDSLDSSYEKIFDIKLLTQLISDKLKEGMKEGNKRKDPRKSFSQRIVFAYKEKIHRGLIENISRSGAFIKTRATFPVGHNLTLAFPKGKKKRPLKLKGKVVWSDQDGFGLEFSKRL